MSATSPAGSSTSSFGYDAAGNTTTRQIAGQAAQTLTWDAEGKLASVAAGGSTLESNVYSADGSRIIRRAGTKVTAYLPGGQELTLDTTTSTISGLRYYAFAGQTIAVRNGPGLAAVTTLIPDSQGTALASIANSTDALTRRYTDPFGAPRGTAATAWVGDHGFLNKVTDAAIGLTQVGARYLDTALGRFISVDPVMDLADPQQWNAYAYSNNNPVTWSDPTGLLYSPRGDWARGPRWSGAMCSAPTGGASPLRSSVKSSQLADPMFWSRGIGQSFTAGLINSLADIPNALFAFVDRPENPALRLVTGREHFRWTLMANPNPGGYGDWAYTAGGLAPLLIPAAGAGIKAAGSISKMATGARVATAAEGTVGAAEAAAVAKGFATGADEAVFWSGVGRGGDKVAAEWVAKHGGSTLETTLASRGITLPAWDASSPAVVSAWRDASAQFARGASGNVRVLQGDAVRMDSVWAQVEFPALKANTSVTSITAINPSTGVSSVIWRR